MSANSILGLPRSVVGATAPWRYRMADALARFGKPVAPAPRERGDLRLLSELDHSLLRDLAAVQSRIAEKRALAESAPRAGARNED